MKKYECSDSFVVTKKNQQKLGPEKDHAPLIVLALPMNEEFQAAYESACLADQQNTMTTEAGDAFDRLIELNAAQRISACLLKVTATYKDGASETKKYMISPVENFEELYLAFQEKRSERLLKEWKASPKPTAAPKNPSSTPSPKLPKSSGSAPLRCGAAVLVEDHVLMIAETSFAVCLWSKNYSLI